MTCAALILNSEAMRPDPVENRAVTSIEPDDTGLSPSADEETARASLSVRLEALAFDVELARKVRVRLESELRRMEQHNANLEVERTSLRNRLDERERYVSAIHASLAWKLTQAVRGVFGRRW